MKILLADDHTLFRQGIRLLVEQLDEPVEVLEADTVDAVLALLDTELDLLFLDLNMPGMANLAGFYAMRRQFPELKIIILSASEDGDTIKTLMQEGAKAYLHKSADAEVMLSAMRRVLAGEIYLDEVWQNLLTSSESPRLAPRQREVLVLMAEGKKNKQIATVLEISENTVKSHVKSIFDILSVRSRFEAIAKARELGILCSPEEKSQV